MNSERIRELRFRLESGWHLLQGDAADLLAVLDEVERLRAENQRLEVQLAACATAALGYNDKPAKQGDYGWSASYQDVLNLRAELDAARAVAGQRQKSLTGGKL